MSYLDELIKLFEGKTEPKGPWVESNIADSYTARGYPLGVNISNEASQLIRDMFRGRHSKESLFVLIDYSGDVNHQCPTVASWPEAVYQALTSNLIVYNTRSKRCSRPCWIGHGRRTLKNMVFEPVWCIPTEEALNSLPTKRSRLFHIDGFNILDAT